MGLGRHEDSNVGNNNCSSVVEQFNDTWNNNIIFLHWDKQKGFILYST